jgi:hypothetical protein
MRRAHRIPQGRDKWNIFLPFKKSQRTWNRRSPPACL